MKRRISTFLFVIVSLLLMSSCVLNNTDKKNTIYDVGGHNFGVKDYDFYVDTIVDLQSGNETKTYSFGVDAFCDYEIIEYSAIIGFYSKNNALIYEDFINQSLQDENDYFKMSVPISEDVFERTYNVEVTLSGKAYEKPRLNGSRSIVLQYHNVSFMDKTHLLTKSRVKHGETVKEIDAVPKNNYIFGDWYKNSALTVKFDFSESITRDTTVYASYNLDGVSISNAISTEIVRSVVTVHNSNYDKNFWGSKKNETNFQGSGVIWNISNGYCYVLTNCHVVKKRTNRDYQEIVVTDYQGRTYEAKIYENPKIGCPAISADYDLAMVVFKAPSSNLQQIPYSTDPKILDDVIFVGSPEGQQNAVRFGKVLYYNTISLVDTKISYSNVTFPVIIHSARTSGGASGGPVLNSNLDLVGLHYSGSDSADLGGAIPISKILEFLESYVYE